MARTTRRRAAAAPADAKAPSTGGQARRVRENLPRPATAPAPAPGQRAHAPRRSRNPFRFLGRLQPRFVADIISELRKVTWPTFAETRYLTVVVAIVAVAVGILLGGIDLLFGWIVERLFF
ncbi:preprotein translocase subunit SecE [bacterium]|nr:MAG: preprotein translocase subunit SecE [bacterium]MCL4232869.1 preprotein translocase subunit SecE [Dehalococcoidia bacterium]